MIYIITVLPNIFHSRHLSSFVTSANIISSNGLQKSEYDSSKFRGIQNIEKTNNFMENKADLVKTLERECSHSSLNKYWILSQDRKTKTLLSCPDTINKEREASKYLCGGKDKIFKRNKEQEGLEYKDSYLFNTTSVQNFINGDKFIIFVGDSMMREMSMTLNCMMEAYSILGTSHYRISGTYIDAYLTKIHSNEFCQKGYPIENRTVSSIDNDNNFFKQVKDLILSVKNRLKHKKTAYLMINTGAWWSPMHLKSCSNFSRFNNCIYSI